MSSSGITEEIHNSSISEDVINQLRFQSTKAERIVFMVDLCQEMNSDFADSLTRLDVLKRSLEMMVWRKTSSAFKHEYSLVTFNSDIGAGDHAKRQLEYVSIVQPFTRSHEHIKQAINTGLTAIPPPAISELIPTCDQDKQGFFDLTGLFSSTSIVNLALPTQSNNNNNNNISEITRIILIYGNSYKIPQIAATALLKHPNVYCDVLYLHHKLNSREDIQCGEVFEMLQSIGVLQGRKNTFIMATHHLLMRLYSMCAALIAHPLQRVSLEEFFSTLDVTDDRLEAIKQLDHR